MDEITPPTGREAYLQAVTCATMEFSRYAMEAGELRALLVACRPYVEHAPQSTRVVALLARIDKALGVEPKG